jgi:CheY-like chemotaxis protein
MELPGKTFFLWLASILQHLVIRNNMEKRILLVDDEKFFLEGLKEGLSDFKEIFATDICFSVDEAIKLFKKHRYDLIISDIRMPRKSGLDLFVYLKKQKYQGGFFAMTAYGTEEVLSKIKKLGGLDIILKPFSFSWFKDKIMGFFVEEEGVSGTVNVIDLTSLLQMINLEKKSLSVKISINDKYGYLHFKSGEIIHAEFDNLEGEEAAFHLIRTRKGRFSVEKQSKDTKHTIDTPFMVLLMNVMKKADEEGKVKKSDSKDEQKNEKEEDKEEKKDVKEDKDEIEIVLIDIDKSQEKSKEVNMNIKKLNQAIEIQKDNMGDGLLATDIYGSADGQSLVGWNSNPQACALFNRITNYMIDALDGAGFPGLGRYYIMDLVGGKMVIVISLGEFQWGMLVDRAKIQLGLLLNVIMPKMIDSFEQAMAD